MISEQDSHISERYHRLMQLIEAQGVRQWTEGKVHGPDLAGLVYLCKFSFFTGILTKAQIGQLLGMDRQELKHLVKSWYDDHRAKGCGTC